MRTFFRAHWKAIVAIVLLILLALVTVNPSSALPQPSLSMRLRAHVAAIGADGTARYIGDVLESEGYRVRRQPHTLEVSVANVAAGSRAARIFIIGARYGAGQRIDDAGSGSAAVLELARLLKGLHPSRGTEVKFVFSENDLGGTDGGSFIAFVGAPAASGRVQEALSAFQAASGAPARGLAAPAYVQGVTLSAHGADRHAGDPAVIITESAFLRYPYRRAAPEAPTSQESQDSVDYDGVARVVAGLARTIRALAAGAQA